MMNVSFRSTRYMFIVIIASIFLATFLLAALSGIGTVNALVWTVFGLLAIWYPADLVPETIAVNSSLLLVADSIAAIGFVVLTAFLTAMFYSFIRNVNLRQRSVMRRIRRLSGHVILSPMNSFSEAVNGELKSKGIPSVTITDNEREARRLYSRGELSVVGSASNIELLNAIRLQEAKAVVLCSDSPTENAMAAVTVKTYNKRVKIIARVNKEEDLPKLSKAGVHMVILPEVAAGTWLGSVIADKVLSRR